MALLYPRVFATERAGRRMVAACVGDELHELGVRTVAEVFELHGWDSVFLGADAPPASIVAEASREKTDLLCPSCTIGSRASAASSGTGIA